MRLGEAIRIAQQAAEDARDMAVRQERAGLHDFARINAEKARALEMVCKTAALSRSAVNALKFPPESTGDKRKGAGKVNPLQDASNASEGQINAN